MDFGGNLTTDCALDDPEGLFVQQESSVFVGLGDAENVIELVERPSLLVQVVEPLVVSQCQESVVIVSSGNQGPPGKPGAGALRFSKALVGLLVVIPQSEHGLTDVTFSHASRAANGREVSLLISISIGGTVTVESLIPMDGITLTLE